MGGTPVSDEELKKFLSENSQNSQSEKTHSSNLNNPSATVIDDKSFGSSICGQKRKRGPDESLDEKNNFNIDISCSDTGSDPKKPHSTSKNDFVSKYSNL